MDLIVCKGGATDVVEKVRRGLLKEREDKCH